MGQSCPPEAARPPQRDPCAVKYVVDLPILGEEEVEVPVEQLSQDFMSSVVRRLPSHLPQIFRDIQPHVDEMADELIQDTLELKLRPEIEAQKAALIGDIRTEANKAMVTMGFIALTIVGGVGLAAWYTYKRAR